MAQVANKWNIKDTYKQIFIVMQKIDSVNLLDDLTSYVIIR